eukprot:gene15442-4635_t
MAGHYGGVNSPFRHEAKAHTHTARTPKTQFDETLTPNTNMHKMRTHSEPKLRPKLTKIVKIPYTKRLTPLENTNSP